MKVAVIIVAAGRGQRVGAERPKQYLPLCGKSVLQHSIEAFLNAPYVNLVQTVIHKKDRALYDQATAGLSSDISPDAFLAAPVIGGRHPPAVGDERPDGAGG